MKFFSYTICFALLFSLCLPLVGQAQTPRKVSDEDLSKRLLGKWQVEFEDPKTKRQSIGWTVYAENGLAASRSITKVGDKEINLVLQAKWKIENGVLITTITKSSDTSIVKVASVTKDRLTVLTSKQLQYIDADGNTIREIRVPNDTP
ncbi:MAG: hypothetical protein R3C05_02395 [Pirellulaceae bacterium]